MTLSKIWRMSSGHGLLLGSPALLLIAWYCWNAWITIPEGISLSAETLQIALYDQTQQIWRKYKGKKPSPYWPLYQVQIGNQQWAKLFQTGAKHPFVAAKLFVNGQKIKSEIRLQGKKTWHLVEGKKSWRLKLDKGRFVNGYRSLEWQNPNRPLAFETLLSAKLAKQMGLFAIEHQAVQLQINGMFLGVYLERPPLGEFLLRQADRMPGNLYSLDRLNLEWRSAARWEQRSQYDPEPQRDDLKAFLDALQAPLPVRQRFADQHLDLKAFAKLDAFMLLLGDTRAEDQELPFALYFDPYTGRCQPLLFDYDGLGEKNTQASLAPLQASYPILQSLSELPQYQDLRAQALQELLQKTAPLSWWQAQGKAELAKWQNHQDPYLKANQSLLSDSPALRQWRRPLNAMQLQNHWEQALENLQRRMAYLSHSIQLGSVSTQTVPEQLHIGPGIVAFNQSQVYSEAQQVSVLAGTVFKMGPGASLIFRGKVTFDGTAQQPIKIEAATDKAWGGIVIQGPATAGSSLKYLIASGGSMPHWHHNAYPGMINLHDSHDIKIIHCHFGQNQSSDDLLHSAYVQSIQATGNRFYQAHADAWDLEFSDGTISDTLILKTGDDGFDIMDSDLTIQQAAILETAGNGVSTGEDSHVQLSHSLFRQNKVALLVKNASDLQLRHSLIMQSSNGFEVEQKSEHYPGSSWLQAQNVYFEQVKNWQVKPAKEVLIPFLEGCYPASKSPLLVRTLLDQWQIQELSQLAQWQSQEQVALGAIYARSR